MGGGVVIDSNAVAEHEEPFEGEGAAGCSGRVGRRRMEIGQNAGTI